MTASYANDYYRAPTNTRDGIGGGGLGKPLFPASTELVNKDKVIRNINDLKWDKLNTQNAVSGGRGSSDSHTGLAA